MSPLMNDQERNQINRRFAKLVGLCWWHELAERYFPEWKYAVSAFQSYKCTCSKAVHGADEEGFNKHCKENNPDFISNPWLVLEEMMKLPQPKGREFLMCLNGYNIAVPIEYLVNVNGELEQTGLLVNVAIKWIEKREEGLFRLIGKVPTPLTEGE